MWVLFQLCVPLGPSLHLTFVFYKAEIISTLQIQDTKLLCMKRLPFSRCSINDLFPHHHHFVIVVGYGLGEVWVMKSD